MTNQMRTLTRRSTNNRRTWHGSAFVIEALALLFFMVSCMAILLLLFSYSFDRSDEADQINNAVILATNSAEHFAANPDRIGSVSYYGFEDGVLTTLEQEEEQCYIVQNKITTLRGTAGTTYNAEITVTRDGENIYTLETSRYVSSGGVS